MEEFYETPELEVVEVRIPYPLLQSGSGSTEGGGSGGDDIVVP